MYEIFQKINRKDGKCYYKTGCLKNGFFCYIGPWRIINPIFFMNPQQIMIKHSRLLWPQFSNPFTKSFLLRYSHLYRKVGSCLFRGSTASNKEYFRILLITVVIPKTNLKQEICYRFNYLENFFYFLLAPLQLTSFILDKLDIDWSEITGGQTGWAAPEPLQVTY